MAARRLRSSALTATYAWPRYASTTRRSRVTASGGAVGDLLAEVERDDALGHRGDHPHVVLDHEEREAAAVQLADELHQPGDAALVHAAGHLVEQQHARLGGERARELEALALAGGERARVRVGLLGEPDPVEQLAGARRARAARRACG